MNRFGIETDEELEGERREMLLPLAPQSISDEEKLRQYEIATHLLRREVTALMAYCTLVPLVEQVISDRNALQERRDIEYGERWFKKHYAQAVKDRREEAERKAKGQTTRSGVKGHA